MAGNWCRRRRSAGRRRNGASIHPLPTSAGAPGNAAARQTCELNMTSAISQPHRILSSIAFLMRPFFRFAKVACRLRSSWILRITIFLRPMGTFGLCQRGVALKTLGVSLVQTAPIQSPARFSFQSSQSTSDAVECTLVNHRLVAWLQDDSQGCSPQRPSSIWGLLFFQQPPQIRVCGPDCSSNISGERRRSPFENTGCRQPPGR